ncbi:alpha-hydroxy acid oxidase [Thioclava sp. FTW29]|uniref:Alpha-hydroxy acid oxidase n=1 Tax=Thioclava litoralis TaxID=3076557 RepID=A0ABZ1E7Z2_9RHOB|nr:alpha-hydroxy acid oxidase [Thioclava sp. FTW29]
MSALHELEDLARPVLSAPAYAYISGGAGDGAAIARNRAAWGASLLRPQIGRQIPALHCGLSLLGTPLEMPVLIAPMAYQRLAHPDGEAGMARAAAAQGAGFVLSCQSTQPAEEIAPAPFWFQIYLQPDPEATQQLALRALNAGATALVVTMDAPLNGIRNREIAAGFRLPEDLRPVMLDALPPPVPQPPPAPTVAAILAQSSGWEGLAQLCARSTVPVLAKGVLTPEAARQAMACGCAGVIVSNHGGRVLEGLPATATALPAIRAALGQAPVLVDGGIRTGEDVFRARALGADAVLVGRPFFYALALEGAMGVARALRRLKDEFAVTMGLMGCARPEEIGPIHLWPMPA